MDVKRLFDRLLHGFNFFNLDYRFAQGRSLAPRSVCLILSRACNLKCLMCDIGRANAGAAPPEGSPLVQAMHGGDDPMTLPDWLSLIDQLAGFVPKPLLLLTGAEPFLAPHWRAIAAHILHKGLRLHITTNGTLLQQCTEELLSMCPRPSALDITVSIDGLEAVHDRIRGTEGTFHAALAGMRTFAAAWQDRYRQRVPLHITCTISNHNLAHLPVFIQGIIEHNLPVEDITFNHLWFRDSTITARHNSAFSTTLPVAEENIQGVAIDCIDADELISALREVTATAVRARLPVYFEPALSSHDLRLYYSRPEQFVGSSRCTAAWRNVAVTPAGTVILSPLCFLPPLGRIKGHDFREMWNAQPARALRRSIARVGAWPACARCCMLFGSKPKYHKLLALFRG
jgi:MoaA/NifB/PqqE/SkfB family radical SAM enzyme